MKLTHIFVLSMILLTIIPIANAEEINADIKVNIDNFYNKLKQIADQTPTEKMPRFLNIDKPCNDSLCYIAAKRPAPVNFEVKAVDYTGKPLNVTCEHLTGHVFPVGKTRVLCYAEDSSGNGVRGNFIVTVGFKIVSIPSWFKTTVHYYITGKTDSPEFFSSLEYLLNHEIISIPGVKNITDDSESVPSWVIQSAKDWSENKTGDHEFSIAISWLIEHGIVSFNNHQS